MRCLYAARCVLDTEDIPQIRLLLQNLLKIGV